MPYWVTSDARHFRAHHTKGAHQYIHRALNVLVLAVQMPFTVSHPVIYPAILFRLYLTFQGQRVHHLGNAMKWQRARLSNLLCWRPFICEGIHDHVDLSLPVEGNSALEMVDNRFQTLPFQEREKLKLVAAITFDNNVRFCQVMDLITPKLDVTI